ncbi:MAG: lipid-A-disaccharide synthase, partial [bacterium]
RTELGIAEGKRLVAILPGSRSAEVASLLPSMLGALAQQDNAAGVIALAGEKLRPAVCEAGGTSLPMVVGSTWDLVAAADLVLLASGTATLETALLGTPMVVSYRLSALTYAIVRMLVRVDHIAMPNLILERRAVPELVQSEVSAERMAAEARAILDEPDRAAAMRADLAQVRDRLGQQGAAGRAAAIATEMLGL